MKRTTNNSEMFSINSKKVKMKEICCIICVKYRKFKNSKMSSIFNKPLVLSIIYFHYLAMRVKSIWDTKKEILKIFGLIITIEEYQRNM